MNKKAPASRRGLLSFRAIMMTSTIMRSAMQGWWSVRVICLAAMQPFGNDRERGPYAW
jgi:hypothetical protein